MIHTETHLVDVEHGPRPNGRPDKCFYCSQLIGKLHKNDCVMRQRTVVIKAEIELVVNVPEQCSSEDIEGQRNDSCWCASNVIEELSKKECLCAHAYFSYVREATEDDEKGWNLT